MRPLQTNLKVQIPVALAEELLAEARAHHMPAELYAAQVIEQWCAERRMKRIDADKLKQHGVQVPRPRMKTTVPKGVFVLDMTKAEEFLAGF